MAKRFWALDLNNEEMIMKYTIFAVSLLSIGLMYSTVTPAADEPISPIQPAKRIDLGMVELGKKLFYDRRLSASGHLSCNSCHNLSLGGVDNQQFSVGHKWQKGGINTPTVLNSSMNLAQFWNGRAATLQEQAGKPVENPVEMASSHTLAVHVLETIPGYVAEFKQVFGKDEITMDKVTEAIAEFEKTLVTPNSRFDKWLLGDSNAITQQEQQGYELFKNIGCSGCHYGPGVGGETFQKFGLAEPYKTDHPARGKADVTGNPEDENVFKVPLLRNVELTYPYFHDGAVETLEDAVDTMARVQLGTKLTRDENAKIVAFLNTLTGEQPSFPLPHLHPSSPDTPRPQPFSEGSY